VMIALKREHLVDLVGMDEVIETTENAFELFAEGLTHTPQRTSVKLGDRGQVLYMPCLLEPSERESMIGFKLYTEVSENSKKGLPMAHAGVLLVNGSNGKPSAFMEGMYLTGLRTGAVSAVAGKYLLPEKPKSLGLIGAGFQGYFQIWALSRVRNFEEIRIYDPSGEQMEELSRRLKRHLNLTVILHESSASLVKSSDVLVTATSSTKPVLDGKYLRSGATVFAIGSYNPGSRELGTEVVRNSEIYIDSRDAALSEAGDLLIPLQAGDICEDDICGDLAQLVSGEIPGRTDVGGSYLFKAVGLAFEDLAVAQLVYSKAIDKGVGTTLDLFSFKE